MSVQVNTKLMHISQCDYQVCLQWTQIQFPHKRIIYTDINIQLFVEL